MSEIIRFESISKRFGGVQALDEVSFSIMPAQVHAIIGENGAGKSTLMNILSGLYGQGGGKIIYKGKEVKIQSPHIAHELGIATVFQELKLCQNLTVAENLFLGRELTRNGRMDWKAMNGQAVKMLEDFGVEIDVKAKLKHLSVAQMQMVEIAKAVSQKVDVLILDEPTSALTVKETDTLFKNIRRLKSQGVTILFISHRLDEIFEVSDEISILRNGRYLGTFKTQETNVNDVVTLIAGKELAQEYRARPKQSKEQKGEVVLEVENLCRGSKVNSVSFELHKGEILGFYGLQGSGRTETLETIFGLYKKDFGSIKLYGKNDEIKSSGKAICKGMAFIPEDRKLSGIFDKMDIRENMAIIHDKAITTGGLFLKQKAISQIVDKYVKKLCIKCISTKQLIGNLSGGNQQKVIVSRCLSTEPDIILLDEPTRGVDVGAKAEIYDILKLLKNDEGKSIIIVSSELPEIILLCDRVLIMRNGKITGELEGDDISKERILQYAFNG